MTRKIQLLILSVLLIVTICCSKVENLPILKTTEISKITAFTAVGGGSIIDDIGDSIITRGVCWGIVKNPTIGTNNTVDGKGKGSFVSQITGLNGETTYFVRAYATNSFGTGYGNSITFKTLIDPRILEAQMIQSYISSNANFTFQPKTSGLYYCNILAGTGVKPLANDTVSIKYTLKLLNGTILDTNVGTSKILTFIVGARQMISGLEEGVLYMNAGGKAILILPSSLAYGAAGYYSIPGYTPLIIEVELVNVKQTKALISLP